MSSVIVRRDTSDWSVASAPKARLSSTEPQHQRRTAHLLIKSYWHATEWLYFHDMVHSNAHFEKGRGYSSNFGDDMSLMHKTEFQRLISLKQRSNGENFAVSVKRSCCVVDRNALMVHGALVACRGLTLLVALLLDDFTFQLGIKFHESLAIDG